MAARFTYSRWDGTQSGFELDADDLFDEITDDLLYHGDVNAALRRMMQQGFERPQRRAAPGPARDDGEAAPAAPGAARPATTSAASTTRSPTSCDDVVDEERHALDERASEAARAQRRRAPPGDSPSRSPPSATSTSTCCPPDLAGKVQRAAELRLHVGRGARSSSRS